MSLSTMFGGTISPLWLIGLFAFVLGKVFKSLIETQNPTGHYNAVMGIQNRDNGSRRVR